MPRTGLTRFWAVGAVALLAVLLGVGAGYATRDAVDVASTPATPCPAAPEPAPAGEGCRSPSPGAPPVAAPTPAPAAEKSLPLRALAGDRELRVGAAVSVEALADERYRTVLGREFNAVTAENAMKWGTLEPERGQFRRDPAQRLLEFAREHDQQVYGHTLVWHKQIPEWARAPADSPVTRAMLRGHVLTQVDHFQGDVWAWDVVNEAFDADGTLRESFWLRQLGPGYLADAFEWAREADPDVRLFINDFGIEGINAKSDALYAWVKRMREQGVPVDGVGFQVHWPLQPLPASFVDNLERFAELGVQVAITEMDVRVSEPATAESLGRQAEVYAQAMLACLAVPACVSFTVWGVTDAHSWVPHEYPGIGAATLFDAEFRPKPAYHAVADALRRS